MNIFAALLLALAQDVKRDIPYGDAERQVLDIHARENRQGDEIVASGGRVLTVLGHGPPFQAAIDRAYDGVSRIHFGGMQYRQDIALAAVHAHA